MYWFNFKNWENNKYAYIFIIGLISLLLLSVIFKNMNVFEKKGNQRNIQLETNDLKTLKDFLVKQIKSPYLNISHEIKKGETIGKILKKYKIENKQIQGVINQ